MDTPHPMALPREGTTLLLVDVQERLFPAMDADHREEVMRNIKILVATAKRLKLPIIVTEQYAKGLGHTLQELRDALPADVRPVAKVPSDIAWVSWVALRQLMAPRAAYGVFRAVPFRCGEDEGRRVGRSALAESLGSFAPNTIVIGVDPERELILGHQLRRTGGAEAIDVLGLG